ncbi:MAG: DUF4340 domain-containing protein [bacterium]|nr:DUF4340 domain-containing protein [bacterium]
MLASRFRKTALFLGIFVLLLLLVIFYAGEGAQVKRQASDEARPVLTESVLSKVRTLSFLPPSQEALSLQLSDEGHWTVEGYRLDEEEFSQFFDSLKALPMGKLVSMNQLNWEKYGVDESSATALDLQDASGITLTKLFLGNSGPGMKTFYLRSEGSDEVSLVNSDVNHFEAYTMDRWRDKRLFPIDPAHVTVMKVRISEESWSFTRDSGAWEIFTGSQASPLEDQDAVQQYFDDLMDLKALSIEPDVSFFAAADNAVSLSFSDGSEFVLSLDSTGESEAYAQITDQADLFKLNSDLSSRLRPVFLKPPTEAEISGDGLEISSENPVLTVPE